MKSSLLAAIMAGTLACHAGQALAHGHGAHAQHGGHSAAAAPAVGKARPAPGVTVENCWIRALPGGLPSAAYFRVRNDGDAEVVLQGVQSDAFGRTMLHDTKTVDGMARMVMAGNLRIAPGHALAFAPGGLHAMLEKPKTPLEVGAVMVLNFWFDGERAVTGECLVRPAGALE